MTTFFPIPSPTVGLRHKPEPRYPAVLYRIANYEGVGIRYRHTQDCDDYEILSWEGHKDAIAAVQEMQAVFKITDQELLESAPKTTGA